MEQRRCLRQCLTAWLLLVWLCWRTGQTAASLTRAPPRKAIHSFAGPYRAFTYRIWSCEADRDEFLLNLRTSHFNPSKPDVKQNMTGNFTGIKDIDDSMWSRVRLDIRSNNQWKENAFQFNFPGGICSVLRANVPDFYRVMFKLGPTYEDTKTPCKVPRGVYVVKDEPIDWSFPKFPVMPYGHYRFVSKSGRENKVLFCMMAEVKIIPKSS